MNNQYNGSGISGPPPFAKVCVVIICLLALTWFWVGFLSKTPHRKGDSLRPRYKMLLRQGQNYPELWAAHQETKAALDRKDYRSASIAAQKCLSIDPKFYRAYMNLGVVYSVQKNYLLADEVFKSALRYVNLDPVDRAVDTERIYFNLGWNDLALKNIEQSWSNFRMAYNLRVNFNSYLWKNDKHGILKYVVEDDRVGFTEAAHNFMNHKVQNIK